MTSDADIRALHAAYCAATGFAVELTMQRMFAWEPWAARGYGPDDIRALVRHHKDQGRAGRPMRSLLFRNLIAGIAAVESAEEDLAMLRARSRVPAVDAGRASVLRATGRPEDESAKRRSGETSTARPAGAVAQQLTRDPAAAAAALAEFLAQRKP